TPRILQPAETANSHPANFCKLQTANCRRLARGLPLVDADLGRLRRGLDVHLPRPVEEDLLVGARLILIAHELERAVQALDCRLDGAFRVAPAQLELVDVVIELLEPDLRLLEEQIG